MHEGVAYDFISHTQHPLFVAKIKESEIDITDEHFITVDKIELNKKTDLELAKMMGQLADFIAKWRSFQNGKSKDVPE
jgi:hypothetical protein